MICSYFKIPLLCFIIVLFLWYYDVIPCCQCNLLYRYCPHCFDFLRKPRWNLTSATLVNDQFGFSHAVLQIFCISHAPMMTCTVIKPWPWNDLKKTKWWFFVLSWVKDLSRTTKQAINLATIVDRSALLDSAGIVWISIALNILLDLFCH